MTDINLRDGSGPDTDTQFFGWRGVILDEHGADVLVYLCHELVLRLLEHSRVGNAADVVEDHHPPLWRAPLKQHRAVDGAQRGDPLGAGVQLAEALELAGGHARRVVLDGGLGVGYRDRTHGRVGDAFEGVCGGGARRAQDIRHRPRGSGHHHGPGHNGGGPLRRVVRQLVVVTLLGNGFEHPAHADLFADLFSDGVGQRLQPLLEGSHGLAGGLGREVGVPLHGVLLAVLEQFDGSPHEGASILLQHVDAAKRRLHGQLRGVAGVHPGAEGLDEPLKHLPPQVATDELLHTLLKLWHRLLDADGAQPRADLPQRGEQREGGQAGQAVRRGAQLLVPPNKARGLRVRQRQVGHLGHVRCHAKDGISWLEAVGSFFPHKTLVVGACGDVASDSVA
mmetsp:Transcript_3878/g.7567  ORF Transcript_3878/g.7567 Transcript_3878/m.7567 type:complete len:394 (+) Transcript_3878:16-1197(+)